MIAPTYTLRVEMDNDAFAKNPGLELARILREIADRVDGYSFQHPTTFFPIRDANGNKCGRHGYANNGDKA